MKPVAFGLGANLGDPRAQVMTAARWLCDRLERPRVSSLYRTAPVGGPAQPDFINAVVVGTTSGGLSDFQAWIQELEADARRVRGERWGPRTLDVDLLLWGQEIQSVDSFRVPHRHWRERAFVLAPLNQVAPDWVDPEGRGTVAEIWATLVEEGPTDMDIDSSEWLEAASC